MKPGQDHDQQPVLPPYKDHIGLWREELRTWVPEAIFDAHVHIGSPQLAAKVSKERRKLALTTFLSLEWETLEALYPNLFSGKRVAGLIAFPFPQREVDLEGSNDCIIEVMRRNPQVKGFLASHPTETKRDFATYRKAEEAGVCFSGVKPYSDRLGKNNFEVLMTEFIPDELMQFMDDEGLVMMLHTSGIGVGARETRTFLRSVAGRFPRIKILLAHMGRYIEPRHFLDFMDSGLLEECPSIYLEMSSASSTAVYRRVLEHRDLWGRILFGSDLPFGLITGVECWSEKQGAVFLSRDRYEWSDPQMDAMFDREREKLTYNTYHCIKALKDAFEACRITGATAEKLKEAIFLKNALTGVFGESIRGPAN